MIDVNDPTTAALLGAVSGQYTIEREIGRGGMGVVYLADDAQLERPVAIKTLPQHLAADPRVRDRFVREARTAGRLSHPNIVPIYVAAERANVVFFAMRYINGESLADRIVRNGPLPPAEVVSLLRQLASALGYAHANGVVHRDIKAENVLLDSETGRAMLTDFGIARVNESPSLTATGTVLGTVHYMSPEQVSGEDIDGRSDLYSLGILAFYALSGRFPFERPSASAVVVAHVTTMPPKLCSLNSSVPADLGDIVDRLLAKSPNDRYADGYALREALDALPIADNVSFARRTDSTPSIASRLSANERTLSPSAAALPMPAPPDSVVGNDTRTPSLRTPAVAGMTPAAMPPAGAPGKVVPEVMSSDEAQQVWARAAELQANTGMIVPPAAFRPRPAPLETVGYDASLIRESAVDAGIDARYVDRALMERSALQRHEGQGSVARAGASAPLTILSPALKRTNPFIGAPLKIEFETAFDGELSDVGFEEIADEIRRGLGEMVTISSVGRSMTVTSAASGGGRHSNPRRVQIHLSSRNGRTTLRAFEDLSQLATAMMFGITMGGGFGGGSMLMGMVVSVTHSGPATLGVLGGTIAVAFTLARTLFTGKARRRSKELREVLERVAKRGQELVAEDRKRLAERPDRRG